MILQALKALADAEGLMEDPDYEFKPVTRAIELSRSGNLLGVTDLRVADARGKPRPQPLMVPKISGRTAATAAQFLYDKTDYLLGFKVDNSGKRTRSDSRLKAALDLHHEAWDATKDRGLGAVAGFLERRRGLKDRTQGTPDDLEGADWFVFRLDGEDGFIHDRAAVREWWKSQRVAGGAATATCLVTGNPCKPVAKHDGIKRVPGGSTSGVAIVTFNSDAYESYGWSRNENAPIGREAAESYVRALNRLLDPAYPHPKRQGLTLPRRNVRLNDDTAVVFWAADPREVLPDIFGSVVSGPNPEVVGKLYEAPKAGKNRRLDASTAFFALTLSGGQGRATIRDWYVTSVSEMRERMKLYFEDLELVFPFDSPPPPSLAGLLKAIVLLGEEKNIPPNLAADTFRAILRDGPLPKSLLQAAVRRCRAEGPISVNRQTTRPDWNRSHLRMQVLKLCIRRLGRSQEISNILEVQPVLDENNTDRAYVLGRLFAVLEGLQANALDNPNATIGDRFYGAASSTPGVAFPRLVRLSRHHLSKLRKEKVWGAVRYDKLLGHIFEMLPPNEFPAILSMEEQGLFAIGYYHQRQALFSKKEKLADETIPTPGQGAATAPQKEA